MATLWGPQHARRHDHLPIPRSMARCPLGARPSPSVHRWRSPAAPRRAGAAPRPASMAQRAALVVARPRPAKALRGRARRAGDVPGGGPVRRRCGVGSYGTAACRPAACRPAACWPAPGYRPAPGHRHCQRRPVAARRHTGGRAAVHATSRSVRAGPPRRRPRRRSRAARARPPCRDDHLRRSTGRAWRHRHRSRRRTPHDVRAGLRPGSRWLRGDRGHRDRLPLRRAPGMPSRGVPALGLATRRDLPRPAEPPRSRTGQAAPATGPVGSPERGRYSESSARS